MQTNLLFLITASLLFLFMADGLFSQTLPQIRQTGRRVEDFVPKGWDMIGQAKGDLNKDGLEDIAVALKEMEEDMNSDAEYPRLLLILFKNQDKSLTLSITSSTAIFCKTCGGAFGDPFESLDIKNNTVTIGHYGGSSQRWARFDTFKFINNEWILIEEKNATMEAGDPDGTYKETVKNQKELGNITLKDFDIKKKQ